MKLMVLVPSFRKKSPVQGAFLFAKYLYQHDVPVMFVSLDQHLSGSSSLVPEIQALGLPTECLGFKGWRGLYQRRRLSEFVRAYHFDAVVSYLFRPDVFNVTLSGVARISSIRGFLRKTYVLTYGPIIGNAAASLHMHAIRRLDHVFSMSPAMKEWLVGEGIPAPQVSIHPNFIDVGATIRSGVKALAESVSPCSDINIGLFGPLIRRKRPDLAITGISRLVRHYGIQNVCLHIAGSGPWENRVRRLVAQLGLADLVRCHGHIDDPLPLMRSMDLILSTSESEGVPRSLMEALALGRTCVVAAIPGIEQLIKDGETGYLFPSGNGNSLAAVVAAIIRENKYLSPERLERFMFEHFDVDQCCERMLRWVQSVVVGTTEHSTTDTNLVIRDT